MERVKGRALPSAELLRTKAILEPVEFVRQDEEVLRDLIEEDADRFGG